MLQTTNPLGGATLSEILLRRLEEEPDGEVCRLVDREGEAATVTVRELMSRANAFAARFGPASAERKIVAVCLYHGLDLQAAFVGAILAGHTPTMIAPPSPRMEPTKYTKSFCRMLKHIRPAFVVIDSVASERLESLALRDFPSSLLIDPATVHEAEPVEPWAGKPDDVAVLQHSSGTTGLQKGVALSHRAIVNHNRAYAERLTLTREDVIVSWLPLYHDMGFIACFILPLLQRIPFVQLSQFDWVLKPVSLLKQIDRRRGTLCWLPNFAFQLMADSVRASEIPDDLSLHSMRAWVNCSEPVSQAAHQAFYERFHEHGVRWEQFTASYAMAENVFAVSQSLPGDYRELSVNRRVFTHEHRVEIDQTEGGLSFVSNGKPVQGTEIAVLDESDQPLPENCVGELAVRGDYRFAGYFGRDDLTEESLTAGGWYRTGDLGFIHSGEIYVTGRKKDLIIIQGRNIYPADVEQIVAEIDGVIPGRVAAFGLPNESTGTEGLVVLAEAVDYLGEQAKRLSLRIRNAVAQELDCTPYDVRIIPPRWLIKSTAGKLARNDNRDKYLENFVNEDRASLAYV